MTVGDHFERVAAVYESLRTTDEAPVRRIRQLLPDRPVTGLDIGCGTGRYSRLLRGLLPDGSLLVAGDVSAAMLAELKAGNAVGVAPMLSTAEDLPVRTASLDLVTAFNCVHHFDLDRFLAAVARVLQPDGQLFIFTRTPGQNARTVWGRYFPGFTDHERRLHSEATFRDAVRRTAGLKVVATQTFEHPRSSTVEQLRAQAEGRHYSTFSLYPPDELRASIATFVARVPPTVSWVDEHLLVVVGGSGRAVVEHDSSSAGDLGGQGSGPPSPRRPRGEPPKSRLGVRSTTGSAPRAGASSAPASGPAHVRPASETTSPGPDVGRSSQRPGRGQAPHGTRSP